MKRIALALLLLSFVAGGCSCSKEPYKIPEDKPVAETRKPELAVRPASELPQTEPSRTGIVRGTIQLGDYSERRGHLFLYVIEPMKLPEEVVVVASAFFASSQLTSDYFEFEMTIPASGNPQINAVWDTSPPYCLVTDPYCPASHKDGLGQATVVGLRPGGTVDDIYIEVK